MASGWDAGAPLKDVVFVLESDLGPELDIALESETLLLLPETTIRLLTFCQMLIHHKHICC